jgi:hypothetical protein
MNEITRIKHVLKKEYKKRLMAMAKILTREIETAYESAINKFYADYTPSLYDRTYSTYAASDHYMDKGNVITSGNDLIAGITVASDNIPGEPYYKYWGKHKGRPMNKNYVFSRTYEKGIHGINIKFKSVMNKNFNKEDKIVADVFKALDIPVGEQNGGVKWDPPALRYNEELGRVPLKNMKPTPKSIFEKEYRNNTSKKYLDDMADRFFSGFFDEIAKKL